MLGITIDTSQAHSSHEDTEKALSVPSRGIKRTFGGRKPPPSPSPPPAAEEPTASETEEEPAPVTPRHRGIRRTIGSRRPAVRTPSVAPEDAIQSRRRAGSEGPTAVVKDIPQETNGSTGQDQEAEVDPEEALRRADNKRKALQRQLAQQSAPKVKKRKF
jgi:hypothetical protein